MTKLNVIDEKNDNKHPNAYTVYVYLNKYVPLPPGINKLIAKYYAPPEINKLIVDYHAPLLELDLILLPVNLFLLLNLGKEKPDAWIDFLCYQTPYKQKSIETQIKDNKNLLPVLNNLLESKVQEIDPVFKAVIWNSKTFLGVKKDKPKSIKQLQLWSESFATDTIKPLTMSATKNFAQMVIGEQKNYFLQLVSNPEYKSQIEFEDKKDDTGLVIDSLYDFSNEFGDLYRYFPYYEQTGHVLLNMVALRNYHSLPYFDDEIDTVYDVPKFSHFVLEDKDRPKVISANKVLLTKNELELKYFEGNNFRADIDMLTNSSVQHVKVGPLLFEINLAKYGESIINIFYLNSKKQSKIHLLSAKESSSNNLGGLTTMFLPLKNYNYRPGRTITGYPNKRAFKKILTSTGFKISNELKKILFGISLQQKSRDVQTDLAVLRPCIKRYLEWVNALIKASQKCVIVKIPEDSEIINARSSLYFMDRDNPGQIDALPLNPQEVIEKIMGLYNLNLGISDINIQAVICQYFTQNQPKNLNVSQFVAEIYGLKLILERSNLSIIIKQNDFSLYAEKAWEEYLKNPQGKFPLDKEEFDPEFFPVEFESVNNIESIHFPSSVNQIIFSYMGNFFKKIDRLIRTLYNGEAKSGQKTYPVYPYQVVQQEATSSDCGFWSLFNFSRFLSNIIQPVIEKFDQDQQLQEFKVFKANANRYLDNTMQDISFAELTQILKSMADDDKSYPEFVDNLQAMQTAIDIPAYSIVNSLRIGEQQLEKTFTFGGPSVHKMQLAINMFRLSQLTNTPALHCFFIGDGQHWHVQWLALGYGKYPYGFIHMDSYAAAHVKARAATELHLLDLLQNPLAYAKNVADETMPFLKDNIHLIPKSADEKDLLTQKQLLEEYYSTTIMFFYTFRSHGFMIPHLSVLNLIEQLALRHLPKVKPQDEDFKLPLNSRLPFFQTLSKTSFAYDFYNIRDPAA
jgi:hypothetical protein